MKTAAFVTLCFLVEDIAGSCPEPLTANVTWSKASGKWYTITTPNIPEIIGYRCLSPTYKVLDDNKVTVENFGIKDGKKSVNRIIAEIDKKFPGKLTFKADDMLLPFWYLEAEYNSHMLLYMCAKIGPGVSEGGFIISRTRTLQPATIRHLQKVLRSQGLDSDMVKVDQSNCPED